MLKKSIIAIALLASTPALADWNGHHGYRIQQRHYNHGGGGGDVGAALFGGLIGGMILNQMMQPPRQQYYYQPVCQTVFLGKVWNGWTWVEQYQQICN